MTLSLRVAQIVEECGVIKSFELVDPDGRPLPPFTPGAHLRVAVQVPGGLVAWRSYSIASDPADRSAYVIAVLLERRSTGGSEFMHRSVRKGEYLQVRGPDNHFPLADEAGHHILVAGGIGITPILSMARVLAPRAASYELHYSARSPEVMAFQRAVTDICGTRAKLYFDNGDPARGVDLRRLVSRRPVDHHIYVCGPRAMIEDVRRLCAEEGWSAERVHFEFFAPSASEEKREAIEVYLARAKATYTVPPDSSILDALVAAGVEVDYDCKRGECGVCSTRVLEGEPLHEDLYLNERERLAGNVMQICVSWAKTRRLVLDL